jgi:hypothetical protein
MKTVEITVVVTLPDSAPTDYKAFHAEVLGRTVCVSCPAVPRKAAVIASVEVES